VVWPGGSVSDARLASLFDRLLGAPPPCDGGADFSTWWASVAMLRQASAPAEAAALCGWAADRLGFAFAGGYHAALRRLLPELDAIAATALCATEEGGAHPRAIRAALARAPDGAWTLSGHKRWVTLGGAASSLLVLGVAGEDACGRKDLRLARLDAAAPGVRVVPLPPTAFVPEIPHAEVHFDAARVEALLPGDGWERWVKPFRSVEDLHVYAAQLGYLLGVAQRARWPEATREALLAALAATHALSAEDPAAPALHVALAGLLDGSRRWLEELEPLWQAAEPAERARWERDRPLLAVAGRARAARRERAWQRLGARPG
jgi:alkylation response protein AidB-like acyl-CoA dehydrogenase